jgi:hypothetical protein
MQESIETTVARIDQRLGDFIARIDRAHAENAVELEDLRKRVENLERWRAALIGGSAVVGAVTAQLWALLTR